MRKIINKYAANELVIKANDLLKYGDFEYAFCRGFAIELYLNLPLTLTFINLKYSGIMVCAIATFAAIQEGHFIRKGKKYIS